VVIPGWVSGTDNIDNQIELFSHVLHLSEELAKLSLALIEFTPTAEVRTKVGNNTVNNKQLVLSACKQWRQCVQKLLLNLRLMSWVLMSINKISPRCCSCENKRYSHRLDRDRLNPCKRSFWKKINRQNTSKALSNLCNPLWAKGTLRILRLISRFLFSASISPTNPCNFSFATTHFFRQLSDDGQSVGELRLSAAWVIHVSCIVKFGFSPKPTYGTLHTPH
jgi:hypothetical protein